MIPNRWNQQVFNLLSVLHQTFLFIFCSVHIYIYMCVCVCVCILNKEIFFRSRLVREYWQKQAIHGKMRSHSLQQKKKTQRRKNRLPRRKVWCVCYLGVFVPIFPGIIFVWILFVCFFFFFFSVVIYNLISLFSYTAYFCRCVLWRDITKKGPFFRSCDVFST